MCSKRVRGCLFAGFGLLVILCICTSILVFRALGPSSACQNPTTGPVQPGTSARSLVSSGRQRCYLLHVPPGYEPGEPAPVVFALHGFASTARGNARVSGWDQIADDEGFLVVYPEGTSLPQRWNAAEAFFAGDVDDVQFFRDLVADLSATAAIDPAQIFVSGMSNGGAMTRRLACEAADVVAAVGTVAAVPLGVPGGCRPSRPVPVIAFHGTDDPLVQYEGGTFRFSGLGRLLPLPIELPDYVSAGTWIADWAERNGCQATPESIPSTGDARGIRYTGCRNDAEVVLVTIEGGGHTWPGSAPIPFLGKTSQDIEASATMWEFFQAHPLTSIPAPSGSERSTK